MLSAVHVARILSARRRNRTGGQPDVNDALTRKRARWRSTSVHHTFQDDLLTLGGHLRDFGPYRLRDSDKKPLLPQLWHSSVRSGQTPAVASGHSIRTSHSPAGALISSRLQLALALVAFMKNIRIFSESDRDFGSPLRR
jgi:hypothetical protein